MKKYELVPHDGRKSFYGKAFYTMDDNGDEVLYSYGTPILKRTKSGDYFRVWSGWSATTGRHIAAFCGLNKKAFEALPYEHEPREDGGGRLLTWQESLIAMMARRNEYAAR